jgi:hypothetical protein
MVRLAPRLTLQIRYALIRASPNRQAGEMPRDLLVRLVELGVWTAERALTYSHLPGGLNGFETRVALLPMLIPQIKQAVVLEAIEVA